MNDDFEKLYSIRDYIQNNYDVVFHGGAFSSNYEYRSGYINGLRKKTFLCKI